MIRYRFAALASFVLLLAGSAPLSAQTPLVVTRTPTRGPAEGGTTVEVLVNGWLSTFGPTTVTMQGGGPPVTNIVVHDANRLTFVTPARTASPTPHVVTITSNSIVRTTDFRYVQRTRSSQPNARRPVFSYDGQHVAFESRYALAPTDTNGLVDIYVRNRATGLTRRVSISTTGGQALGGESTSPAISANGRFVAFQSRATNLVPGDTNGRMDVFVHDRDADGDGQFDEAGAVLTERVSLGVTGGTGPPVLTQALGGDSGDPAITGNGRFVAFHSAALNLVAGDSNQFTDVFVFDRQRRVTRRVSTNANNVQADGHSQDAAMSLDGRFVAFESFAHNLDGGREFVPNTSIRASDVFLHDRDTDQNGVFDEPGSIDTVLVSVNPCGSPLTNHSIDPSITYDGNFVVFATVAGNAKVNESCLPDDFNGARDIFIWNRLGDPPTLRRLSEPSGGSNPDLPGASGAPVLSGNGNLLLFRTQAVNAGGASSPRGAIVAAAGEDGKSTTGSVPSPTTDTPPPPEIPPAPPTGSNEEPSTSGDGNTTGNTTEPDPGTGAGEPVVELDETPPDENGTPFIAGLSPTSGPTAGGATVEIQGGNFIAGTTVQWGTATLNPTIVSANLLRVTAPAAPGGFDQTISVRAMSGGEASNSVQYHYVTGLTAPSITSFNPTTATTAGGGNLVITGTNFTAGAVAVRFGPTAAVVAPGSTANSITVTIPAAAAAGPVPIVVQNSNGTTAVSNGPFTYTFAAVNAAPVTQPLTPDRGPVTGGTAITITGQNFTQTTGVTVGGVPATDVQVLSNTQIVAVTPAGAEGPAEVVVATTSGTSTETFVYEPVAPPILTCTGTDTDNDGMPDAWETQYGLNPNDATDGPLDPDNDLLTNAQECTALTHPRGLYTRYLAEGATGSFFDTRVVLANPGATPGRVLFRFQTHTGEVVRHYLVIPATSRRTLDLRLISGLASANISSVIEADVQVVVDRTMRWDQTSRTGAHAESSAPAPSLTWYLAEGATHGSFDLFYLIQNPSPTQTAQVRIRYLLPVGGPVEQTLNVNPNSRATVYVDQQPGLAATDVSAVVETLNGVPIIVERAMYSSAAGTFAAGHDSAGVTAPSLDWFFAEGATGGFFDTFILLANPNGSAANVRATYLLPSGQTIVRDYTVPANSRRTINVQQEAPELAGTAVSTRLSSQNAVSFLAERAMWWPHGQAWTEAHNAAGATATGTKWAVGDGEVGNLPDDTATYLLVANTSASAATVRVTLLFETGAPITQDFSVPANSRFNVPVLSTEVPANPGYMRVPRGTRFSAIVESLGGAPAQIVVERAMYWNAAGQFWAAGSDLLATKLQ